MNANDDTPLLRAVRAELRARKGDWTRLVVATGVPQPTLTRIASGAVADPSVRAIERLGQAFGLRLVRGEAPQVPKARRARRQAAPR